MKFQDQGMIQVHEKLKAVYPHMQKHKKYCRKRGKTNFEASHFINKTEAYRPMDGPILSLAKKIRYKSKLKA